MFLIASNDPRIKLKYGAYSMVMGSHMHEPKCVGINWKKADSFTIKVKLLINKTTTMTTDRNIYCDKNKFPLIPRITATIKYPTLPNDRSLLSVTRWEWMSSLDLRKLLHFEVKYLMLWKVSLGLFLGKNHKSILSLNHHSDVSLKPHPLLGNVGHEFFEKSKTQKMLSRPSTRLTWLVRA